MAEPYVVVCAQRGLAEFKKLHGDAVAKGVGPEFLEAAETIYFRLRRDPGNFGEALYRLRALNLTIQTATVSPLIVHFGVNQDERLVIIQRFQLLFTRDENP